MAFGMKRGATLVSKCLGRLSILLLASLAGDSRADSLATPHVKVELIAEEQGFVPGRRLWVGLRFVLEKDWHIYWVNPGDSGEPPRVEWSLPTGFRAGPIRWPYPIRLGAPPVVDYGYEDEVLLMLPIQAPAHLKTGETVPLAATAKWLVCREICIPGKAQLTLALPVVQRLPRQASPGQGLFEETRKRVPRPAPSNWKVSAVLQQDRVVLTVETGARESQAAFFPLEAGQIENAEPQRATPFARGVRLTLKKSGRLLKPLSILKGVLVLNTGRAFEVAASVPGS